MAMETTEQQVQQQVVAQPTQPVQQPANQQQVKVLKGDDVDLVFYQDTLQYPEFKKGTQEKHRYANQDYFILSFNGINFTTRNRQFITDLRNGNCGEIHLLLSKEMANGTLTDRVKLSGYITLGAKVKRAQAKRTIRLLDETPASTAELQAFQFADADDDAAA